MKNILISSYSFIAAVIGAGFASGQEILCYFSEFGKNGFIGIVISCIIFALFTFAVFSFCRKKHIYSYSEFLHNMPFSPFRKAMHIFTGIFSFAVYAVMLAASGEIISSCLGIDNPCGALICTIICSSLFCYGCEKIFCLNGIIGIFMVTGIIICCLYILCYREYHVFSQTTKIMTNSFTYSGYNLITTVPVLVSLSRKLDSSKDTLAASLISAVVLFIIMSLIYIILAMYSNKINLGEFPMLTMAFRQNTMLGSFYNILLILSIATTMLSSGGSVCETFSLSNKPLKIWAVGFFAYFISGFGFSNLIDSAYRICGIIGFMLVLCIIYFCFKKI